jgi:hypothetical protein
MKKLLIGSLVIIFGFVYFSCSKDSTSTCAETIAPSTYEKVLVNDLKIEYGLKNVDQVKTQVDLTIKSESEYKKYISSSIPTYDYKNDSLPTIDFSKKSIIAGRYISKYADFVKSMSIEKACDKYTLTVHIGGSSRVQTTYVYYFALVDVTGADAEVKIVSEH